MAGYSARCVGWRRNGTTAESKSKAVSPPASPADATYFWCGKNRQNRSCGEGARQTAPGSPRFSHRTAGSELAPFGRSDMRNRNAPFAAAILGAIEADGWTPNVWCMSERILRAFRAPLPSPPPSIAGRAGKRAAACLSGGSEATIASSADPGPTETRRGPVRRLRQQPWDRRRRKEMVARDGSIASAKYAGFMPAIQPPRAAR